MAGADRQIGFARQDEGEWAGGDRQIEFARQDEEERAGADRQIFEPKFCPK